MVERSSLPTQQHAGWIWEDNLRPFGELVAGLAEYAFDASDHAAILEGLKAAAGEEDIWFEYPFVGKQTLTLAFSRDAGSSVIQVQSSHPAELDREIRLLFAVCATYTLSGGSHV